MVVHMVVQTYSVLNKQSYLGAVPAKAVLFCCIFGSVEMLLYCRKTVFDS